MYGFRVSRSYCLTATSHGFFIGWGYLGVWDGVSEAVAVMQVGARVRDNASSRVQGEVYFQWSQCRGRVVSCLRGRLVEVLVGQEGEEGGKGLVGARVRVRVEDVTEGSGVS